VDKDKHTEIIIITVVTDEPKLSADIANAMIEELDIYNREFRKNKATDQRKFIEGRLIEVKNDLTKAENQLKTFREKNRKVVDSPELLLEQERRVREVEMQNTIYVELNKQYELVKIEEVKDIPIVDVLDAAVPPVQRFKPQRKHFVLMMTLLSGVLSVGLTLLYDFYQNNKQKIRSAFPV
jgi:uncharacterized protein involved in exopolysaccharide biosynthesis